jgi:glutamate dehydrogenase/leucine dehydrogenase
MNIKVGPTLTFQFSGILTGKGADWGGSLIRPEATG